MTKAAEVKNVLKSNGVTVTYAQADAYGKNELDAAALDKAAGGFTLIERPDYSKW